MLFYILLFGTPIFYVLTIFLVGFFESKATYPRVVELCVMTGLFSLIIFAPMFVYPIEVWSSHAQDLGTIEAQQEVIDVYEKEVAELNKKLSDFEYPKGALLNADSPVASIVASISVWHNKLAQARAAEAEAKKSIEQRRYSAMSGVIGFVGDYK